MTSFSSQTNTTSTASPGHMVPSAQGNCLCPDALAERFLNDWPCGTPKSFGNGFTEHMDGASSMFASGRVFQASGNTGKTASQIATETREAIEATGRNIGTIKGLSKKVEQTQQEAKRYHVVVTKGPAHDTH